MFYLIVNVRRNKPVYVHGAVSGVYGYSYGKIKIATVSAVTYVALNLVFSQIVRNSMGCEA